MSLTILVAKATRRIHSHAVRLHTKALRGRVKAAERATRKAERNTKETAAIALEARKQAQAASLRFHRLRVEELHISEAAQSEADLIGGKL